MACLWPTEQKNSSLTEALEPPSVATTRDPWRPSRAFSPRARWLYEVLVDGLAGLYKTTVGQSTVPSELARKPESSDKDRPLTAAVAQHGGLKVRYGRKVGVQRPSPERGVEPKDRRARSRH